MTKTARTILTLITAAVVALGVGQAWAAPQGPDDYTACDQPQTCPAPDDDQPDDFTTPTFIVKPDPDPQPDPDPEPEPEPQPDPGAESSGHGSDVIVAQPRFTG